MDLISSLERANCVRAGSALAAGHSMGCAATRERGPDPGHLCAGSYPDADLRWWADRIGEWDRAGQDVFVYFNNDGDANAVRNARTLRALLDE
jgi:hypothetical protein